MIVVGDVNSTVACALTGANPRKEGVAGEKIHFVGNTMMDTLRQQIGRARQVPLPEGLEPGQYAVLTLGR